MLTETAIRSLKPSTKAFKKADEKGLYLRVEPSGSRLWRFKYRIAGREKLLSFGSYPDVGLKLARERRDEARKLVAQGTDPSVERKAEKTSRENSFRAVALEWIGSQTALADETISIHRGRLEQVLFPAFGSRPVNEIKAPDILPVLKRVEAAGKNESAHRLRALISRVFRYAVSTGRAEQDPTASLRGALAPVKTEHFPAITNPARLGVLLRAIDASPLSVSVHYALRLAPLVFVRPGELRGARWSEFEFDHEEPTWRIPKERMKMDREHVIPLSRQAVALLNELKAITGDGELLFPGTRGEHRELSENTLNVALRALGFAKDEMTCHGFRTVASTMLNELGWHPDLIELQLAHAPADQVRAAYNRSQRLQERRKMMQAYSDFLDGLKAGGSVVGIKSRAS
ncbi:MAG: integrase arm-type DNA-binding domain-containing protein [Gammaproteobacteria bacterium]